MSKFKRGLERDTEVLKVVKGKKVLHIGPCDWPYTKEKIANNSLLYGKIDKICLEQLGIDLDKNSIKTLNESVQFEKSNTILHNMNNPLRESFGPDVIIFGETIEHLMNIQVSLENLKKNMDQNTKMIISTPNAYAFGNFFLALFSREFQHPDHKVLFSRQVLQQTLYANGLRVNSFDFVSLKDFHGNKLNFKGKIAHVIGACMGYIFPYLQSTLLFNVSLK